MTQRQEQEEGEAEPEIVVEGCSSNEDDHQEPPSTSAALVSTLLFNNDRVQQQSSSLNNNHHTTATTNTTGSTTATTTNTTTAANAGGKSGGGLSELSKQLRSLQHTNQSQSLEIDKLQRQLRILSDLHDVNVNDIRSALEKACEAEAFGELQTRITSLQAELEVVALTAATSSSTTAAALNSTTLAAMTNQQPLNMTHTMEQQEMKNMKGIIANLELRIGELEEIEEQHRNEVQTLYQQLQTQQLTSLQVQSTCDQLRTEKEQCQLQLQQLQQQQLQQQQQLDDVDDNEKQKVEQVHALTASVEDTHSSSTKAEIQELQMANIVALGQVRDAETYSNMLVDKLKLCAQQRDTIDKELSLRNSQYKARFIVQDENIEDLRQQLLSLYTAYELMKEEKDRDDSTRYQLQTLLGNADAEVARQVDEIDQSHRSFISSPTPPSSTPIISKSPISPYHYVDNSTTGSDSVHVVPPESPMLTMDQQYPYHQQQQQQQQQQQPSSIVRINSLGESAPLMSGDLLIKDTKGLRKKWRKRHAKLFATISHFHLDVGEDKGYAIQIGISSIEIYSKYPYGISIYMGSKSGMSLVVATTNDKDFQDWMAILTYATTGTEISNDEVVSIPTSPTTTSIPALPPTAYDYAYDDDDYVGNSNEAAQQSQTQRNIPPTLQEQQESDLELALELSEREYQLSQRQLS